jgi:hypothetical protein
MQSLKPYFKKLGSGRLLERDSDEVIPLSVINSFVSRGCLPPFRI